MVLDIIFQTIAETGTLDAKLACKLACISKEFEGIARSLWSRRMIVFKRRAHKTPLGTLRACSICIVNDATTPFGMCSKCTQHEITFTSATSAKKEWLLDEDDLKQLTCKQTSNNAYSTVRLFDVKEVKEFAIIKHGGYAAFMQKRHSPKPLSKARMERQTSLFKIAEVDTNVATALEGGDMYVHCIEDYLLNGRGGIRSVKERASRWTDFDDMVSRSMLEDPMGVAMVPDAIEEDMRIDWVVGRIACLAEAKERLKQEIQKRRMSKM